jgi:LSD1 subclass zinc finger protein
VHQVTAVEEVTPVEMAQTAAPGVLPQHDMMAYMWAQQQLAMQYFAQNPMQDGQPHMPFPLLPLPMQCSSCQQMFAYPPGALTIDCPICSATNNLPQQPWGMMPMSSQHPYLAPTVPQQQQQQPPQQQQQPPQQQQQQPQQLEEPPSQPTSQPARGASRGASRGGARGGAQGRGRGQATAVQAQDVSKDELHDAVQALSMTTMRLNPEERQRLNSEFGDLDVGDLTF